MNKYLTDNLDLDYCSRCNGSGMSSRLPSQCIQTSPLTTFGYTLSHSSDTSDDTSYDNRVDNVEDKPVTAYIEIQKCGNIKYEFNKQKQCLEVDRILPYPYFYPYSYGFIPRTLAGDGDDLDILIVSNNEIENDSYQQVYIVGVLVMEDEQGVDEKVLSVLKEDYIKGIQDLGDLSQECMDDISWFFANYKSKTECKWSKVIGFEDKKYALDLYEKCRIVER